MAVFSPHPLLWSKKAFPSFEHISQKSLYQINNFTDCFLFFLKKKEKVLHPSRTTHVMETSKLLLCSKSVGTVQRVAINTEYKYFTMYLSSDS